ncbi:MAG: DUF87 domain-containing protein [Candidatus Jordarchaeales archaeon]
MNFLMLSEAKRNALVEGFQSFLNSLTNDLRIMAVRTGRSVTVKGEKFETKYYRFFVESVGTPIEYLLESQGLKYQPLTEAPTVQPLKAFGKHLALPGGRLLRTFTVYGLPGTLIEGFISEVYGLAERVILNIKPLPSEEATVKMGKYMRLLKSMMLADHAKGRMIREEIGLKHEMAAATYQALVSGATRLFEVTVNVSVAGKDAAELAENSRRLRQILQSRLVKLDCPTFLQYGMTAGLEGKKLTVDTGTLGAFYPFISADIIESPGGVFLGVNRLTGAPVIYDPWLRMNQNVLIVGKPGAGKSFLSKILLSRLAEKNSDLAFYIIDPEGEYGSVARILGGEVVDVRSDRNLGLDPLRIFAESKDSTASILADMAKVPVGKLTSALRTIVGRSVDIFDVYEHSPPDLKDYLEGLVDGPDRFLVAGEPLNLSRRMAFNLKSLHREFELSPEKSLTLQAASILLFSKIWSILEDQTFLPLQAPKLVIADEVWLYTSMPASARFLEGVSRRGRKRNVVFLLNTQRVADVLEGAGGKALVENCASKVLLRQDEAAISLVGETFGLSSVEKEAVLEFQPGQGILIAENVHIPVDFTATREEYALFTTKPTERLPASSQP